MKLTRLIFRYWYHWITQSKKNIECYHSTSFDNSSKDGLRWNNGYWMTFWYVLNISWFRMNDKMTAFSGDDRTYYDPMDFCDT